jgi:GlpG protein
MRQIGTLSQRSEAVRFTSYLVTQGIAAYPEEANGQWIIWVREEDRLADARSALSDFLADPGHARYQDVERAAETLLRREHSRRESTRQNTVVMRERWRGVPSARRRPLTIALVLLCGTIGLASEMGNNDQNLVYRRLMFADPVRVHQGWRGESLDEKLVDVRGGQLWRILTPALLHLGPMHLAFNMVMFYQLGSIVEYRRGTWRLAVMMLVIALLSNLAQALAPNDWGGTTMFLGFSGVVYGLIGYVWMKSRYQPELGIYIAQSTIVLAIAFMLFGFLGFFRVANWAHGVGFLVGYVIGIAPVIIRGPRRT